MFTNFKDFNIVTSLSSSDYLILQDSETNQEKKISYTDLIDQLTVDVVSYDSIVNRDPITIYTTRAVESELFFNRSTIEKGDNPFLIKVTSGTKILDINIGPKDNKVVSFATDVSDGQIGSIVLRSLSEGISANRPINYLLEVGSHITFKEEINGNFYTLFWQATGSSFLTWFFGNDPREVNTVEDYFPDDTSSQEADESGGPSKENCDKARDLLNKRIRALHKDLKVWPTLVSLQLSDIQTYINETAEDPAALLECITNVANTLSPHVWGIGSMLNIGSERDIANYQGQLIEIAEAAADKLPYITEGEDAPDDLCANITEALVSMSKYGVSEDAGAHLARSCTADVQIDLPYSLFDENGPYGNYGEAWDQNSLDESNDPTQFNNLDDETLANLELDESGSIDCEGLVDLINECNKKPTTTPTPATTPSDPSIPPTTREYYRYVCVGRKDGSIGCEIMPVEDPDSGYITQEACEEECNPTTTPKPPTVEKWACDPDSGRCLKYLFTQEELDENGEDIGADSYDDCTCNTTPPPTTSNPFTRYQCKTVWVEKEQLERKACVTVPYTEGGYETIEECREVCECQKYNCIGGNCIPDDDGGFEDVAECQEGCEDPYDAYNDTDTDSDFGDPQNALLAETTPPPTTPDAWGYMCFEGNCIKVRQWVAEDLGMDFSSSPCGDCSSVTTTPEPPTTAPPDIKWICDSYGRPAGIYATNVLESDVAVDTPEECDCSTPEPVAASIKGGNWRGTEDGTPVWGDFSIAGYPSLRKWEEERKPQGYICSIKGCVPHPDGLLTLEQCEAFCATTTPEPEETTSNPFMRYICGPDGGCISHNEDWGFETPEECEGQCSTPPPTTAGPTTTITPLTWVCEDGQPVAQYNTSGYETYEACLAADCSGVRYRCNEDGDVEELSLAEAVGLETYYDFDECFDNCNPTTTPEATTPKPLPTQPPPTTKRVRTGKYYCFVVNPGTEFEAAYCDKSESLDSGEQETGINQGGYSSPDVCFVACVLKNHQPDSVQEVVSSVICNALEGCIEILEDYWYDPYEGISLNDWRKKVAERRTIMRLVGYDSVEKCRYEAQCIQKPTTTPSPATTTPDPYELPDSYMWQWENNLGDWDF